MSKIDEKIGSLTSDVKNINKNVDLVIKKLDTLPSISIAIETAKNDIDAMKDRFGKVVHKEDIEHFHELPERVTKLEDIHNEKVVTNKFLKFVKICIVEILKLIGLIGTIFLLFRDKI